MDMLKYLNESNRTAAFAKPDLTLFEGNQKAMLAASIDVVQGGIGGDLLKRAVFYSDPKIDERAKKAAERVDAMLAKLEAGEGRALTDKEMELWHAACGMASESGEIMEEIIDAVLENREINKVNIREELGDNMWYEAVGIRWLGKMDPEDGFETFESVAGYNIAKLTARYPHRFEKAQALERDLEAEKVALTENNSVAAQG